MRERFSESIFGTVATYVAAGAAVLGFAGIVGGGCAGVVEVTYGADKAKEFVEDSGYTHVRHVDTEWFLPELRGCGRDDNIKYEFEAVAPSGREVDIDVCKGILKGATIRQG